MDGRDRVTKQGRADATMSRREFLAAVAAVCCSGAAWAGDEAVDREGGRMVLEGVDRYRVVEPLFEGVRVVLSFLGEQYTPAYIQGISGAAFRVAGPCPCAPTGTCQMGTTGLFDVLGYEHTEFYLGWTDDDDVNGKMQELIPKIKDSIRARRPVLVWHAFTNAEWDVVAGFDDAEDVFLGRGSYAGLDGYASAKQTRAQEAVSICPAFGGIFVGEKTGTLDAKAAELAALKEAVRHARDRETVFEPGRAGREGLNAYDGWVERFQKAETTRDAGDSYCYGVYHTTHRAAAGFLNEIAPKYPDATAILTEAAKEFAAEADALDEAEPLIGWQSPDHDEDRNAKLWPLLARARDHYAAAIAEIEKALPLLG